MTGRDGERDKRWRAEEEEREIKDMCEEERSKTGHKEGRKREC